MISRRDPRWHAVLLGCLALAGGAFYLWRSATLEGPGFPLDDAWIHQTYARNLAIDGTWAFLPGQTSGGSTAPLWTAMLALGYSLGVPHEIWTYGLGLLFLATLVWIGRAWIIRRGGSSVLGLILGAMLIFEWHLSWAALSGMETLALAILAVAVLYSLEDQQTQYLRLGLLIGAGLWLRPDALSLLIPAGWAILFSREPWRLRFRAGGRVLAGVLMLAVPYLLFNRFTAGAFWPTTFYAKQVEYAELRQVAFWRRWIDQAMRPLAGMGALAVPGLALLVWRKLRDREPRSMAALVWAVAFITAYAWRLPVTYQHGRYAIPILAPILLLGGEALARFWQRSAGDRAAWVLARAWAVSWALVGMAFWARGAAVYAEDVAIINTEMVDAARWVAGNTEPNALVAAHDIGAMGYFGERALLDLAGLISPEVIPILRDERALADLLSRHGTDYLVTFPGWYPQLTTGRQPIYTTGGRYSPAAGGENMAVYAWP